MSDVIRALILEDSENDLILMLRALKKAGIDPVYRHAETEAGIHDALKEQWDIVIADYQLQGFTGLDALQIVRKYDENVPFLLVSRTIGDERAVEAMQLGVQDYVLKENLIRLAPSVRRAIREAECRRHRRIAEDALLERTRQLQAIVDTTPDFIVRFDRDLHYLFANRALCEALGIPYEEIIGKTNKELEMDPAVVDNWDKNLRSVFETGQPRRMAFTIKTAGGTHYYETLIAPEIVKDSKVQTLICNTRDLTREVHLQAQLRQAQKMEAIGQLAGGVAHDFNNLLQVIGGNVEMALEDADSESPLLDNLREISRAADRATNLVRQLLIFSRRDEIERQELNLAEHLPGLIKLIRRVIGESIELSFHVEDNIGNIFADPGQVEQVVMNLSINSRDAMPTGGSLNIELRNRAFGETTTDEKSPVRPGEYVCLRVADTGGGIPEEIRERVFEPFFTTKEIGNGTGLGLATVYGIAERHSGFVNVQSQPGCGAAFEIYFPIHIAENDAPEATEQPSALRAGAGQCVLLAEDDDYVRRLARTILERGGYEVIEAKDGAEAIALFEETPGVFDIAVIDVVMPKKNGDQVYSAIRDIRSHLPVLFTTGYSNEAIEERHLPKGQVHLISKPYAPKKLLALVERMLAQ